MNNKLFIKIVLAIFVLAGCKQDFLDLKPLARGTEESFYMNMEAAEEAVTAAYGVLNARDIYDIMYPMMSNIISDDVECGGENTNDWPQYQHIDRLTHSPTEARVFDEPYDYWYKGIRMCNLALDKIPIIEQKDSKADTILLKRRAAEVKFLRAFYHFTLAQVYGGIPIVDHVLNPDEAKMPRNTLAEVYDFIETELEAVIPNLPLRSELGAEIGRASKGAAQALLAKVYLYESSYAKNYPTDERFAGLTDKYQKAFDNAEAVINSGEYELIGLDGTEIFHTWWDPSYLYPVSTPAFRYIFTVDADNSKESIWEIQSVCDRLGWTLTRGNYITVYSTCRFYQAISKIDTITGDTTFSTRNYGWSFYCPSPYVVDAFGNKDSRETGLHSSPIEPTNDPRFKVTIGREGDSLLANDANGRGWYKMLVYNLPNNMIGRKFECSPEEYWSKFSNYNEGPFNLRMIRYADLILMAAEAALEIGQTQKALDYVNMVRQRARNSGNTGEPAALTAVSFEDIVHERRLELANEGHRFYDLVRWNLAYKYINGINLGSGFSNIEFVKGRHEFFPLAESEIQLSGNMLKQYPGWE